MGSELLKNDYYNISLSDNGSWEGLMLTHRS
jgi:hypothetical protein